MGSEPGNTMHERAEGSGLRLWVLIGMNRYALAGIVTLGMFAGLSLFRALVEDADALQNLFSSMMGPFVLRESSRDAESDV